MSEIFIAEIIPISNKNDIEKDWIDSERIVILADKLEEALGKFIVHKTKNPQILDLKEDPSRLLGRAEINGTDYYFIISKPNEIWPRFEGD